MPISLLALAVGTFAIGTTEFVIVGLLPTVADDLGVTLPSAGMLVSLYALGVAVGAPLLTALTARVPRKALLLTLIAAFSLGNLLAWYAPGYGMLVTARILTGLTHGVFMSIGAPIATRLVSKERAASAIALMFSGLTVAMVTGVPLGSFIGQHFGWRLTFLAVAGLGLIAFVAILAFVPATLQSTTTASPLQQLGVLRQPRMLLVYAATALGFGGPFVAFTYLAAILQQVSGFSPAIVDLVLVAYGVSVAAGNLRGGQLADRYGPVPALQRIFIGLAVILAALTFTAASPPLALLTVVGLGAFAFGNVPALQLYVERQAQRYAPHAVEVASGLNIAAFNIGIAGGSWIGGAVVTHSQLINTPWIGAIVVLFGLALTTLSGRLERSPAAAA